MTRQLCVGRQVVAKICAKIRTLPIHFGARITLLFGVCRIQITICQCANGYIRSESPNETLAESDFSIIMWTRRSSRYRRAKETPEGNPVLLSVLNILGDPQDDDEEQEQAMMNKKARRIQRRDRAKKTPPAMTTTAHASSALMPAEDAPTATALNTNGDENP